MGKMDRTKHAKVLSILEKRALRYRKTPVNDAQQNGRADCIDETGTVDTAGLTDDDSVETNLSDDWGLTPMQRGFLEAAGVSDELLRVHGLVPGSKQEGIVRLIYENLNGLNSRMADNEKLEKAREIIDDLEADIVCYNEHRLNLRHKQNRNGFSQLFRGGEAEIRTIAAHNVHESKEAGRIQEGGTAMMVFGPLIEKYDFEESGKDETGLGRLVVMTFRGANGMKTRVLSCYNACYNNKKESRMSYQQQRRYFITKEGDLTCPRTRFREDLVALLKKWRLDGDRLVVCMDANEDVYRKSIGKALTDPEGLNMREVVGDFTGGKLGATYFRGSKLIDAVWATQDLIITGACVMPAGFGVGDHRLFVVDIQASSMIGTNPPKIVRATSRRLSNKLPHVTEWYNRALEKLIVEHRLNSRMLEISANPDSEQVRRGMNGIDKEGNRST
jgi:exonuclease III